jgi:hypothetical protein
MSINIPVNVPWKIIASTRNMRDTEFCNKRSPYVWRSLLSISAYESPLDVLPQGICNESITYLKQTCNITGDQQSEEETDLISYTYNDNYSYIIEEIKNILSLRIIIRIPRNWRIKNVQYN